MEELNIVTTIGQSPYKDGPPPNKYRVCTCLLHERSRWFYGTVVWDMEFGKQVWREERMTQKDAVEEHFRCVGEYSGTIKVLR